MRATKKDVVKYIKEHSFLEYNGELACELFFRTRKHGELMSEQCSDIDISEAEKIRAFLHREFDNLDTYISIHNEWVFLDVWVNLQ